MPACSAAAREVLAGGAERDVQRQQVFLGRVRPGARRRRAAVVEQARTSRAARRSQTQSANCAHVVRRVAAILCGDEVVAQVVRDVARGHDQQPRSRRLASARPSAQRVRRAGVWLDRQRHDRHVGVGEHQSQRHPRAVVEAADGIDGDRQPGVGERSRHLLAGLRAARGRVTDRVKLPREAAEVVDGAEPRGDADRRDLRFPSAR